MQGYHDIQNNMTDEIFYKMKGGIQDERYAMSIFQHIMTKKEGTAAIVGTEEVMSKYAKYLLSPTLKVMNDEGFEASKNDKVSMIFMCGQ